MEDLPILTPDNPRAAIVADSADGEPIPSDTGRGEYIPLIFIQGPGST